MFSRHGLQPAIVRRADFDGPAAMFTDQMVMVPPLGQADPVKANASMLNAVQAAGHLQGPQLPIDRGQADSLARITKKSVQLLG